MKISIIRNLILFFLIQSFLLSGIYCQGEKDKFDKKIFEKIDKYVEKMKDSLEIVGLNYAILENGKLIYKDSKGLANLEHQVPMTLDNLFAVASFSKMFSSIALHNLLKTNERSVNETIGDFLPDRKDLPESWKKLTLKQILSHTSGIPDQIDYQIYLAPESEEFVINSMKDKPFTSKPGDKVKYNATGFLLVRIVIEKLAGQDFESYMQEKYFDKFNLKRANYGGFKKVVPERVTSYRIMNGRLEIFPLDYSSPMYAAAGLNIDINELILWFQNILDEKILNEEELKKIWSPVKLNSGKDGFFGLGWEARKLADHYRMTGHGGAGISSFRHYWNELTEENITVILLTNGAKNWSIRPDEINAGIADLIFSK